MNLIKLGQLHYVDTDKIVRVKADVDGNLLQVTYVDLQANYKLDSDEAERILDWCANTVQKQIALAEAGKSIAELVNEGAAELILDRLDAADDGDLQEIQRDASLLPPDVLERVKARRMANEAFLLAAYLNKKGVAK